jgi:hypothetical protein
LLPTGNLSRRWLRLWRRWLLSFHEVTRCKNIKI